MYTNFVPFMRIFVQIILLLLVRPLHFTNSVQLVTKFTNFFVTKNKLHHMTLTKYIHLYSPCNMVA